jgi:hypothetical protein
MSLSNTINEFKDKLNTINEVREKAEFLAGASKTVLYTLIGFNVLFLIYAIWYLLFSYEKTTTFGVIVMILLILYSVVLTIYSFRALNVIKNLTD